MIQVSYLTLNAICELIVDCEHNTAPTQAEGYPSIRTPNIGKGRLILDGVNRVSEETYKKWTQRAIPRAGDLILAREAPIGNVALIPKNVKVCLGQRTVLIRPDKSKIDPNYLVYLLLGDEVQGRILSFSNGATVHHLNMEDIRNLRLPSLPPLPTQRQIAAILSAYDDLIENNTRRIAILEEIAQSLYREWFVHFRFPGHEKKRLVESELGLIPEGWEVVKVRDISSLISRGISPKYDNASESLVINQRCIRHGRINLDEARRHLTRVSNEKLVRFGDVLVNSTGIGTLGRVAQIYYDIPKCTVDSHVTIVRPRDRAMIDYFGFYLQSLQPHFDSLGVGSTGQTELSRESIASSNFLLPSKNILEAFAIFVSPMHRNVMQMLIKNTKLRQTRDLLLPKLISGEVDVEGLDIHIEGGTYESSRESIPSIS